MPAFENPTTSPTPTPTSPLAEWPTWCLIAVLYGGWLLAAGAFDTLGPLAATSLLALLSCWFMSLQHELLHGHPTRSARLNRLFGLAPLAVWVPYDLYRESHLAHHRDELLTEPGHDPESNYLHADAYRRLTVWGRAARWSQRTLLGRLLFGPLLVIVPLWLDIVRRPLRGDFRHSRSWVEHLGLLGALLWALDEHAGIGPLRYLLLVAYPAMSLALLRSFYEHRPADRPAHRIAINEAGWGWRLLYLNNNYHAVHHTEPSLAWFRIRAAWLADRAGYLQRNGAFLVPGYGHLLRRHLLKPIDSPVFGAAAPPAEAASGPASLPPPHRSPT